MSNPKYQVYIRNDWPLPFVEPWAAGPTKIAKPPFNWKLILVANLGDKYAWGYLAKDIINIGKNIDEHLTNPKNLKIFKSEAKKIEITNRKFAEKILNQKVDKLTLTELASLLKEWYEIYTVFTTRFMPIDATDETLENDIKLSAEKSDINIQLSELSCLLTPNVPTYVQREHKDFCAIAKLYFYNPKSPILNKKIHEHKNKWWWTIMGWGQHKPLDEKAIYKNLAKVKNIKLLLNTQSRDEKTRQTSLNKKRILLKTISGKTKRLLNVFEVLAEMHDTRKEIQMKMMTAGFAITKAMLKKANIPFRYCRFMLVKEYLQLEQGIKPDYSELENRTKAYWCPFLAKGKIKILSGKKALEQIKKSGIISSNATKQDNLIKGLPASPGFAKGKVRVELNANILNKTIKHGEILVTSQTTPEFAPAMKKAAAIITDEGGITSHAAIVSRELGIPCVIGTKIATTILKDGDFIEVDSNLGIIKRIN